MSESVSVRLHKHRERRILAGHSWVFSNEIDADVASLPPGGMVDVFDHGGTFLGRGYANPASLITIRLLSRHRKEAIDHPAFFAMRLRDALALRESVYPGRRSMRLVYSESDRLPGLIIDRYGDVLAVQVSTLGMEVRMDALREAIEQTFEPQGVILRNDARVRDLEGLTRETRVWWGDVPETLTFEEDGLQLETSPLAGQKTGHFFDQYDNKLAAAKLCAGRDVLDIYANTGGWSLHALQAGARSAIAVDIDPQNTAHATANAARNGFADRFEAITAEGKETLAHHVASGDRFGAVVIDPPAFAKQRKVVKSALYGYKEVNKLAIALVEEGGWLLTSSCSFHVSEEDFLQALQTAAREAGRRLLMVRRGAQSADHPVSPGLPESRYLKNFTFRVTTDI